MKRYTLCILLCLLLGVVTTVGVAWTTILTAQVSIPTYALLGPTVQLESPYWSAQPGWPDDEKSVMIIESYATYEAHPEFDWEVYKTLVPQWSIAATVPMSEDVRSGALIFEAAGGWPFLSNFYRLWRGDETALIDSLSFDTSGETTLPLRPILPGFLINTLFYGVIWFGLFFSIGATRRAIRRKRGRCIKCAYNLRGDFESGCPECGWNREL